MKNLICLSLSICLILASLSTCFATQSTDLEYDPLIIIKKLDNCTKSKITNDLTSITLSDGTKASYKKIESLYGGIKYNVQEEDLEATLEMTANGDIYINDKKVKFKEEIIYNISDEKYTAKSGWSKWTQSPLLGSYGDYKNKINSKYSNVVLENYLMSLPESILLTVIGSTVPGFAIAFTILAIKDIKTFYSYVSLNPKELNFYEEQWQYNSNANQYRLFWTKYWEGPKIHTNPQVRYLTIG